jgi:serine/threonine-protein kinase RsbW
MTEEKLALKFKLSPPFGALAVRSVRRTVSYLAGQWGFPEKNCDEIALALSEAINNARDHGSARSDRVEITCFLRDRAVKIRIEDFGKDDGTGLQEAFDSDVVPSSDSERGRGVFLIQSLMDEVEMKQKGKGGVTIVMIKRAL